MKKLGYLLILLAVMSCQKESTTSTASLLLDPIPANKYYSSEIFSESNRQLYGQWQFLYIYDDAGIVAGPGKVSATYDFLVIKKFGVYGKIKDNKLIESGKIVVVAQTSSQFEIELIPDSGYSNAINSWYNITFSNNQLTMTDASIGCGVLYNVYQQSN